MTLLGYEDLVRLAAGWNERDAAGEARAVQEECGVEPAAAEALAVEMVGRFAGDVGRVPPLVLVGAAFTAGFDLGLLAAREARG